MWCILGTHDILDLHDDDQQSDGPEEEVDDDHDSTEHDVMGGEVARPVEAEVNYLKEDCQNIDCSRHQHWIHHGGLSKAPDQAEMKHNVDKEEALQSKVSILSFTFLQYSRYLAKPSLQTWRRNNGERTTLSTSILSLPSF